MMAVTIPLISLALVLLIHLIFVNINIGVGLYSFIVRYRSMRDESLEEVARKAFKVLVGSEFVSGVFGTIITVVLAGLWTPLVNIVTTVLFIPLVISLIGIILRLTSIVGFWYTWDIERRGLHLFIGLIMALSGFMIPSGFRYIFALIDYPAGVTSLNPISGDIFKALANPIYPPLILHTWFGATSIGFLTLASGFSLMKDPSQVIKNSINELVLFGSLLVVGQVFIGLWFALTLNTYSPYMASNIFGMFIRNFGGNRISTLSFIIMVVSAALIIIFGFGYLRISLPKNPYILLLGPLAVLSLLAGEISHDLSRYPYMVVTGDEGILMETFVNQLIQIDLSMVLLGLVPILAFFIVFLIIIFKFFLR